MSTIPTAAPEVGAYLAAVRAALADLPGEERDELCADLEQHLLEVAAESDEPLATRLGLPEAYAAELRASAGLGTGPAVAGPSRSRLVRASRGARASGRRAAAAWTTFREDVREPDGGRWVHGALRDLRPAWWAARGYLAVLAVGLLANTEAALRAFPLPRSAVGLALALGAAAGSLELGRRREASPSWRRAGAAATAAAVLLGLLAVGALRGAGAELSQWRQSDGDVWPVQETWFSGGGLVSPDGREITNLFPYGADGTALDGVLLYDQDGEPVELDIQQTVDGRPVATSYPVSVNGRPLLHVFPQRQVARGEDPYGEPFGAAPRVTVPRLEGTDTDASPPASARTREAHPVDPSQSDRQPVDTALPRGLTDR